MKTHAAEDIEALVHQHGNKYFNLKRCVDDLEKAIDSVTAVCNKLAEEIKQLEEKNDDNDVELVNQKKHELVTNHIRRMAATNLKKSKDKDLTEALDEFHKVMTFKLHFDLMHR